MANNQATDATGFKQDVHRLGQNVDTLKSDLKTDMSNLAHNAVDAARSGAAELRQGAQHAVESARGMAREKYQEAKEYAGDTTESVKEAISRNPLASVGIAAGVGMLIGLAIFRPRS